MKKPHARDRARDTLTREVGYVRKPHGGRLRVALAFPNTYFVGMSSLGFQTVYRLFNAIDDVVCERVFLPPKQELQDQLASGTPLLTLESQTPVAEFDVLAFSVSFEWDYTNLVSMLRLAKLPTRADRRNARHPLVVVGGAVTFVNPEPLALFADAIAAGEGEVLVPALIEAMREAEDRTDLLRRLTAERGFYIPSFYDVRYAGDGSIEAFEPKPGTGAPATVKKAAVKSTERLDPPATSIFTPDTEFGSRFLIEVVRGCANLCRFCWAGYNYLPVRAFPADRILELAREAKAHSSKAGLVSIALCDHPEIERILTSLIDMGYSISPASLRLDDLTPTIVDLLRRSGEKSITIAPEAGSDRLRRVINKTVTNEEILHAAEVIFAGGMENLKLYYMIGLPTERDEDLEGIRDLTVQMREIMLTHGRPRGRLGRIVGSVNPLIPKPGTAYQWLPMEDPAVTERKAKRLRQMLAGLDNVYFNIKSERHSYYQALLSLGDRRVADTIEAAERNGGNWRAAVAETKLDAAFYIFRDRSGDRLLPWDIIDGGMKTSFFKSEFEKGLREEWTLPPKRQKENAKFLPVLS
ncbi:MAG TPA: radical SAM protein [Vicinamibacterales bacterium]|nr:radical SAM protein [Vicinamibacterales bacterium]